MKHLVLFVILNAAAFCIVSSTVTVKEIDKAIIFNVRKSFRIKCNASSDDNKPIEVKWEKDEVPIEKIDSLKNRYTMAINNKDKMYQLDIKEAQEEDVGTYACVGFQDGIPSVTKGFISVSSRSSVKVPPGINVVEGEKLKIECVVYGKPYAQISWTYQNDTWNETDIKTAIPDAGLNDNDEKGIDDAILIIDKVEMHHRGIYVCNGLTAAGKEVRSECMIRIKDKYAALWPFLGICAEVFVLCAIIFIYEKKRNKAEVDDSDTDQSPDQKNTPDHKESNLRHRQQ